MVRDETDSRERLRAAFPGIMETLVEEDVPESQYQCCVCKALCYLSQVKCDCTTLVVCLDHANMLCECPPAKRTLRTRFSENQLQDILDAVVARAAQPDQWQARLEALLEVARPQLKNVRQLVADGERIPHSLPGLADLRTFLNRANSWLERALIISTRKSTGRRRKGRQSEVVAEDDDVDRSPAAINALLDEAQRIGFDTIEIAQLHQMVSGMEQFRVEAKRILSLPDEELDYETCNTALILGQSLNIELPEVNRLSRVVSRLRWYYKIEEEVDDQALQYSDIVKLLTEAADNGVPDTHPGVVELRRREQIGRDWKDKVTQLFASPSISLDDVAALMKGTKLIPTSDDVMRQLESIHKTAVHWQETAVSLLSTRGSAAAAQRLSKSVKSAQGPLSRVVIPEMARVETELEFSAKWSGQMAKALNTPVVKLSTAVENLVTELEEHLQGTDTVPNDDHSCFCRLEPVGNMVKCVTCLGEYHPKCVGLKVKSASAIAKVAAAFQCQMCQNMQYPGRPSFHTIALLIDPVRWNFVLPPPEFEMMERALELSLQYAPHVVSYLEGMGKKEDAVQIAHLLRKIWTLPVALDCVNLGSNEIYVFDEWLYRRFREATDGGVSGKKERQRARKPRFQFVDSFPHEFHCICKAEPLDHLLTVQCAKCEQGFHLSCAMAPITQANSGRGGWRCPFCTVKMGKPAPRGMDLRVQMEDKVGTNEFVDWRQTLFVYADEPITFTLPPNPSALVLPCSKFFGPALPEDFEKPVWRDDEGTRKRRRVTKAVPLSADVIVVSDDEGAAAPATSKPVMQPPPSQPSVPAQNVRPNGRTYYPTHTVVPWEDTNMFSQFQVKDSNVKPGNGPSPAVPKPAAASHRPAPVSINRPPPAAAAPVAHPALAPESLFTQANLRSPVPPRAHVAPVAAAPAPVAAAPVGVRPHTVGVPVPAPAVPKAALPAVDGLALAAAVPTPLVAGPAETTLLAKVTPPDAPRPAIAPVPPNPSTPAVNPPPLVPSKREAPEADQPEPKRPAVAATVATAAPATAPAAPAPTRSPPRA